MPRNPTFRQTPPPPPPCERVGDGLGDGGADVGGGGDDEGGDGSPGGGVLPVGFGVGPDDGSGRAPTTCRLPGTTPPGPLDPGAPDGPDATLPVSREAEVGPVRAAGWLVPPVAGAVATESGSRAWAACGELGPMRMDTVTRRP